MNKRDLEGVLGRKEFKALIDIRNDPFFKGKRVSNLCFLASYSLVHASFNNFESFIITKTSYIWSVGSGLFSQAN